MKYKLRQQFTRDPDYAIDAILRSRGVTDVEGFKHPNKSQELDPYLLDNIEKAADILIKHLRANDEILFIVDCDVDGFTSSAIIWLYIKHMFPDAKLSFTCHEHKQHGLEDKYTWIIDETSTDLVMVPDAGSYDIDEQYQLVKAGIDVVVLDHHAAPLDDDGNLILPTDKSSHLAVVNNQLSSKYSNKSLSGAGVAYKFCEVLDDKFGIKLSQNFIDLAALGNIADVMQRAEIETNYIIYEGLHNIKNGGIKALIEGQSYSLKQKAVPPYTSLTATDFAFYIAPLLNAICRLGSMEEKRTMFRAFVEPNALVPSTKRGHQSGDQETAAEQTARVGQNVRSKQNRVVDQALDYIDYEIKKNDLDKNNIIIVELDKNADWDASINGLCAMRVVSKYNKPCLIGRKNEEGNLQGSMRSGSNYANLTSFKAFLEQSELMNYVAGHSNAAGYSLPIKSIPELIEYANTKLTASDFENTYTVDYILNGQRDNHQLLHNLGAHPEYWGNGVDEPKVIVNNILLSSILTMGANKDSVKISFNGIDYVKFKDLKFIEDLFENRMKALTILGRASLNEYPPNSGCITVQCIIEDYEFEDYDEEAHKYDF